MQIYSSPGDTEDEIDPASKQFALQHVWLFRSVLIRLCRLRTVDMEWIDCSAVNKHCVRLCILQLPRFLLISALLFAFLLIRCKLCLYISKRGNMCEQFEPHLTGNNNSSNSNKTLSKHLSIQEHSRRLSKDRTQQINLYKERRQVTV